MNADPISLTDHLDPEISSSQPARYLSRRYLSSYRFEIFLQSNTGLWNRISDVATKTERRIIYITPVDEYIVTREAARRDRFSSARMDEGRDDERLGLKDGSDFQRDYKSMSGQL